MKRSWLRSTRILIRTDLTIAERAMHIGRRKELYETAHPETKTGKALSQFDCGGAKADARFRIMA
jgi:hypothetical protein